MSFFGFDPAAEPDSRKNESPFFDGNDEDADRYDGLAEDLDQDFDKLNDETFGASAELVGKDFDFAAQTSFAPTKSQEDDEKVLYSRRQVQKNAPSLSAAEDVSLNARSSIPQTSQVFEIPDLKPMASLWETTAPPNQGANIRDPEPKKFLSLEEVEAQFLARRQQLQTSSARAVPPSLQQAQIQPQYAPPLPPAGQYPMIPGLPYGQLPPNGAPYSIPPGHVHPNGSLQMYNNQGPPQRRLPDPIFSDRLAFQQPLPSLSGRQSLSPPPVQLNNQREYGQPPQQQPFQEPGARSELGLSQSDPALQLSQLPRKSPVKIDSVVDEAREETSEQSALTERDMAREVRATRLSQYNGLMTSSDKNHVTRIQLQQLVTEDPFSEDFYYQVFTALHGGRNGELSNTEIAEKYLNEYGRRSRYGLRRQQESMERLQQRAIAAAKAHPKHEQFVVEGALGKIAFSTTKGPRRILDLARKAAEERV